VTRFLVCIATLSLFAGPAWAGPLAQRRLMQIVPPDAVVVFAAPAGDTQSAAASDYAASISNWASLLGLFSTSQQIATDVATILPALNGYDRAVALLDLSSRQAGPDSYKLQQLQAVIIVDTAGRNAPMLKLIKQLLDGYFSREDATLAWRRFQSLRWQELSSQKLPAWCTWQWGAVDRWFVFGLGQGAFQRLARYHLSPAESLATQPAAAASPALPGRWLGSIHVNLARLRGRLEPVVGQRFNDTIAALQAEDLQNIRVAVYKKERRLSAVVTATHSRGSSVRRLGLQPCPSGQVPPYANAYSCIRADPSRIIQTLAAAWLATRNSQRAGKLRAAFHDVEKQAGVDVRRQLLASLGSPVVIHDWPAHPLNWALGLTFIIPHNGGQQFGNDLARFLVCANARMKPGGAKGNSWKDQLLSLQLRCTDDGIWYVHFGPLVLASWAANDRYAVLSWSPHAVRLNIRRLQELERRPTTSRTAEPR